MRECTILGILLLNLVLQSSVFPFLQINHIKPDSLLALVVSFSLMAGNPVGAVVGFTGGLLQDILLGDNTGLYSLQYMLIGYVVGFAYRKVCTDQLLIPIVFVVISSAIKQIIIFIYNFFVQINMPLESILFKIVIPDTLYTIALTPFIFILIRRLYRHKFMRRKLWRT